MLQSDKFKLKLRDFLRGALMAILVPVVLIIQQSVDAGDLVFNWADILRASIAGLLSYLIKNFFTDSIAASQKNLIKEVKKADALPMEKIDAINTLENLKA